MRRAAKSASRRTKPKLLLRVSRGIITWAFAEYARQFSASDYAEAINAVHRNGRAVARFFTGYDILLTPTMCTPPHKLGEISMMTADIEAYLQAVGGDGAFTSPFNVSGNPAMRGRDTHFWSTT
jgi:Asp-tRNA(Asn)/Glu-tRNA(Gln) amidotransferase A subunit family amidase